MNDMDLKNITNDDVLTIGNDENCDGVCGTEYGILWEESLEELIACNDIEIIEYLEQESITLRQDNVDYTYKLFLGTEGSNYESEHIDFNNII